MPGHRGGAAGVALAAGAGALFGLVNVAAKDATLHPVLLAGGSYLLAGLALAPFLRGAAVARRDAPRVAAMALVGGTLAPLALFHGLTRTTAVHASLILTLEMVFTTLLARAFLRERIGGRLALAILALFTAALLVAVGAAPADALARPSLAGDLLVALAALGWGIDNTLSADLSRRNEPHHLIALKGLLGGGATLLVAALVLRPPLDASPTNVRALLYIGLLGIATSTVLFYHALRRAGAALTASVFIPVTAMAGVAGGHLLLDEPVGVVHAAAATLAVAGVVLAVRAAARADAAGAAAK